MKHITVRLLAVLLTLSLTAGLLPSEALAAELSGTASIQNENIEAVVSKRTGGFSIRTLEGDVIQKDDNNKNLLFPLGDDDTSFASLRVTRNGETRDYVFGGKYAGATGVTVAATENQIDASWTVDGITVTQTIRLAGGNEHGMAYLYYSAQNAGESADIQLRLVMDTALGTQDFGYYQVARTTQEGGGYLRLENEGTVIGYNNAFMTYDDLHNPSVIAYFLNGAVGDAASAPEKVTFAHWVHLASTVFDYDPDENFSFVTPYNAETLTADSAFALYYDLGHVEQGGAGAMAAYYGVFSNQGVEAEDRLAMNFTALPEALEMDGSGKDYKDGGDFTVTMQIQNITRETLENIRVAVYPGMGITPYDAVGTTLKEEATYLDPHFLEVVDLAPEGSRSLTFRFRAAPESAAAYRKLTFRAYRMDEASDTFKQSDLLCEETAWIVCPGTESALPAVTFTGSSPDLLYMEGNRSLFLTGTNFIVLEQGKSTYQLTLKRTDGGMIGGKEQVTVFDSSEPELKNRFPIDTDANTAQVVITEELLPGEYQLTVDYQDAQKTDLTAPALRFAVTDDPAYRSDGYGVVTVENDGGNQYSVHTYASEAVYDKKLDNETVLLELRGVFTSEKEGVYTAVSLNKNDNPVSLNGCLDIRDGRVTVTDKDGVINVDFDASLTLPGVGTSVWKGPCCLTSIKDGETASLTEYENGEGEGGTITLLWPSVGQAAQELLGLLFEFKYGELGFMDGVGGVIGFGGALDLSFLVPASLQSEDEPNALDQAKQEMVESGGGSAQDLRNLEEQIPHDAYTTSVPFETSTDTGDGADAGDGDSRSASVEVDDILFGGGGFIGVSFAVAVGLPSYIDGMPGIEGVLKVNTIGDWSVGVSGAASFATFNMSAEISIISRDNIPVPDTLSFFVGGFVPGVNVDGCGVLWLQGAGGGISNLYDTIFLTEAIPPLQLILQAQFSILQVISAKATLELSLQGIGAELSNGTVANSVVVMDSARVELDWYPEFFFLSSVNMNIADVLTGGGYIVVEESGFFEFFIKAALQLPGSLPFVGGLTLADVGMGANADKLWGAAEVLGVDVGVTYFWGGGVEWNGSSAAPSYPDFLSVQAVYTAPETGRTLYAGVGNNLILAAQNTDAEVRSGGDTLESDALKKSHTLTVQANTDQAAALSITWDSVSLEAAQAEMKKVTVAGGTGTSFKLLPVAFKTVDGEPVVDTSQPANTSVSYDEKEGKAIMTVTFRPEEAGSYTITTPEAASLTLYRVEPLPKLSGVSVNGGTATITGTKLSEYSTLIVTAVDEGNPDNTRLLGKVEKETGLDGNSVDVALNFPADMPSGSYTIQAVAYDGARTVTGMAETTYTHTNPNQPDAPTVTAIAPAGDCKVSFQATGDANSAGYRVNFYGEQGRLVPGVSGLELAKNGNSAYIAGGRYTNYFDEFEAQEQEGGQKVQEEMGLQPGGTYTMGVSAYREAGKIRVYSKETMSQVTIPEPNPPEITWSADAKAVEVTQSRTKDGVTTEYKTDSYTVSSFTAILTADQPVTGAWTLDGGGENTVPNTNTVSVPLKDLSEGSHTLRFWGTNAAGDAFRFTKTFQVDTVPPLLQLSGPVDGGFFDEKGVTLSGMAQGTVLTLAVDGVELDHDIPVTNSTFSKTISLDTGSARHVLTLTATDASGNETVRTRTVVNAALGRMAGLALYQDGEDITGQTVTKAKTEGLELRAVLEDGRTLLLNDPALVEWSLQAAAGTPGLEDGTLTLARGDVALVQASFLVSDTGARTAYAVFDLTKEGPDPEKPAPDGPGTDEDSSSDTGYYEITAPKVAHGTVTVSPARAKFRQQVQLTVKPEEGYILASLTVKDSLGRQIPLTELGGGKFSFQMPARGVTVNAVFRAGSGVSSCGRGPECPAAAFDDVDLEAWYHDGIHYCVEGGLMNGYGGGKFGPNETLSRAMLAQILYNQAGRPGLSGGGSFEDVVPDAWYAGAVNWAAAQGIVDGYGGGRFGPNDNITREQLAVMLWRYAGRPASGQGLDSFIDGNKISAWAVDALRWAVEQGIVSGKGGGILDPAGRATRAEAATMLMRYLENTQKQ